VIQYKLKQYISHELNSCLLNLRDVVLLVNRVCPKIFIANTYAKAQEAEEEEEEEQPTQRTQRGRARAPVSDDESEEEAEDGDETNVDATEDSQDQAVKKLVRYALACEFQRMVIRRTGITEKG
jgi:cytoskeletal protein RodZ